MTHPILNKPIDLNIHRTPAASAVVKNDGSVVIRPTTLNGKAEIQKLIDYLERVLKWMESTGR